VEIGKLRIARRAWGTTAGLLGMALVTTLSFTAGRYWPQPRKIVSYDQGNSSGLSVVKSDKDENDLANCRQQNQVYEGVISQLNQQLAKTQKQLTGMVNSSQPTNPPVKLTGENFTGEELWEAVNRYRREHGVPELKLQGSLCELASKRLGELIELGGLDNHEGFEKYFEDHSVDSLEVTNVAENLASGYSGAWETVMGWDSSPAHKKFLLADGAYVWGCAAANRGLAVLIAGY
jgi:uncharacterized protein YkwD